MTSVARCRARPVPGLRTAHGWRSVGCEVTARRASEGRRHPWAGEGELTSAKIAEVDLQGYWGVAGVEQRRGRRHPGEGANESASEVGWRTAEVQ